MYSFDNEDWEIARSIEAQSGRPQLDEALFGELPLINVDNILRAEQRAELLAVLLCSVPPVTGQQLRGVEGFSWYIMGRVVNMPETLAGFVQGVEQEYGLFPLSWLKEKRPLIDPNFQPTPMKDIEMSSKEYSRLRKELEQSCLNGLIH